MYINVLFVVLMMQGVVEHVCSEQHVFSGQHVLVIARFQTAEAGRCYTRSIIRVRCGSANFGLQQQCRPCKHECIHALNTHRMHMSCGLSVLILCLHLRE